MEIFLSGFKTLHSTDSALLRVFNDIFWATDDGDYIILFLFDLFATFDTVGHSILLSRLCDLGVYCVALDWFSSYLADRTMCVSFAGSYSTSAPLLLGVPRASILGTL